MYDQFSPDPLTGQDSLPCIKSSTPPNFCWNDESNVPVEKRRQIPTPKIHLSALEFHVPAAQETSTLDCVERMDMMLAKWLCESHLHVFLTKERQLEGERKVEARHI